MAQTSVRAGQPAEQDEATETTELIAVDGFTDDQIHLIKTGPAKADLIRFRAGGRPDVLATVSFGDTNIDVDIQLTRCGNEVSQHQRNVWETWIHATIAGWHRGTGANLLGSFTAAGVQVKVSRYTNTRTKEEGIHLVDADRIGVTVGVHERGRLVLVGHRYTGWQKQLLADALDQFMAARGKETAV